MNRSITIALILVAGTPVAAYAQASGASQTPSVSKTQTAGQYKPGTLGSGGADGAGTAMQNSINKADAITDDLTPPAKPVSGTTTVKEPPAPKPK